MPGQPFPFHAVGTRRGFSGWCRSHSTSGVVNEQRLRAGAAGQGSRGSPSLFCQTGDIPPLRTQHCTNSPPTLDQMVPIWKVQRGGFREGPVGRLVTLHVSFLRCRVGCGWCASEKGIQEAAQPDTILAWGWPRFGPQTGSHPSMCPKLAAIQPFDSPCVP